MELSSGLEKKLGYDEVLRELSALARTDGGRNLLVGLRPVSDVGVLERWLRGTKEVLDVYATGKCPEFPLLDDADPYIKLIAIPGNILSEEGFCVLRSWFSFSLAWADFLSVNGDDFPELCQLAGNVEISTSLIKSIDHVIGADGLVLDSASRELAEIRKKKGVLDNKLRSKASGLFRDAQKNNWVPEGAGISIKNGRMVIPVFAEHKRKLKGYVQDASATGQTVFIEPAEVIEISNGIVENEYAERREINRILRGLTAQMHDEIGAIKKLPPFVIKLDAVHARALYALGNDFIVPEYRHQSEINIVTAYHPLLLGSNKKEGKETIPFSLGLNENERMLIISGPNAGGKSVALKATGLLQMMFQSGIPVPVGEGSVLGVFDRMMVDIGDDQSIESDLSTYSSHLLNLKSFLKRANGHSLILIDEFGSGTEPVIGGAIAEVILKWLLEKGTKAVITTHYYNIKEFANNNEGVVNASMRYDPDHMQPLYLLDIGKPGSSYAFEIARKIGLPHQLIDEAAALVGADYANFEKMLSKLERQQARIAKREKKVKELEKELELVKSKYTHLAEKLDADKKKILDKAVQEADQMLKDSNRQIEKTIRHIRESKAHKAETKKVRRKLEEVKENIQEKKQKEIPKPRPVSGEIN
ncbi:MAG: endonuclease MutS2, partial [Cyclobacteriaceae bacterium]|nr:endonuclease MutS2 [Cyclobacteriaceae bacterium]